MAERQFFNIDVQSQSKRSGAGAKDQEIEDIRRRIGGFGALLG